MGFIRRHRFEVISAAAILTLYLFIRLSQLTNVPIFTDEAIYLRWAQIALNDASWRFISLTDGKQPLFVWLTMVLLKFIEDPLVAGRLISVAGGLFSSILLYFISIELFKSRKIALLTALVYVVFPFAVVYDRMALYDSVAGALTLSSLYLAILLVRRVRLDLALLLGFSIGLGVLNKSTNFFSLYLLPFTLLLFGWNKKWLPGLLKWVLFVFIAMVIAQGMYAVLRLSPLFHMVEQKNALFIFPFNEWRVHPLEFFPGNLGGLFHWLYEYLGVSYILLIAASFIKPKFMREKILLILYFILPLLALALFARILFPRFIFFMTLSLMPLAAYGIYVFSGFVEKIIKNKIPSKSNQITALVLTVILFLSYPAYVSLKIVFDPVNAPIARPDSAQYLNHWTAGRGVVESVNYLENEAMKGEIFVATEGTFGLLPFALELYLIENPNITIKGYWPLENELPKEVIENSKRLPTYIIFYQPNNIEPPNPDHLELIQKTKQGNSDYYYRLYQVYGY